MGISVEEYNWFKQLQRRPIGKPPVMNVICDGCGDFFEEGFGINKPDPAFWTAEHYPHRKKVEPASKNSLETRRENTNQSDETSADIKDGNRLYLELRDLLSIEFKDLNSYKGGEGKEIVDCYRQLLTEIRKFRSGK